MNIAVGVVVVALLVVFALSLAAGYFWGRHQATARLRELVEVRRNSFRLGQLVPDEPARRQLAKAYYDPEAAFRELDHYCWDAPNVIPTPFVGYMPAPEHQNRFTTNARQFRAPREVESPKSDRTYRIFLLGGSTAFGSGAPDQSRTIGGYLERMVVDQLINQTGQRCELFTAAVPAWASTHERIAVENLVSELEPDLVLTLSGCNDAHWAWDFKDVLWFRSYADRHIWAVMAAAYEAAGYPFPEDPIRDENPVLAHTRLAVILEKNIHLALRALAPTRAPFCFFLQPALAVTKKQMSARESETLGKWHPAQIEYYRKYYAEARRRLTEVEKRETAFRFFDLSGIFDERNGESVFIDSYHFGDKGYEVIAREMFRRVGSLLPAGNSVGERAL